jgi:hypothetical protein
MAVATAKRAFQRQPKHESLANLGSAYSDPKSALIAYRRASDLGYKDPALGDRYRPTGEDDGRRILGDKL